MSRGPTECPLQKAEKSPVSLTNQTVAVVRGENNDVHRRRVVRHADSSFGGAILTVMEADDRGKTARKNTKTNQVDVGVDATSPGAVRQEADRAGAGVQQQATDDGDQHPERHQQEVAEEETQTPDDRQTKRNVLIILKTKKLLFQVYTLTHWNVPSQR